MHLGHFRAKIKWNINAETRNEQTDVYIYANQEHPH
jgi:hypothetical protein